MRAIETSNMYSSTLFFSTIREELLAFVSAASKPSLVLDKPLAETRCQFAGYLSEFGQRSSTDFGQLGRERPLESSMRHRSATAWIVG